MKEIVTLASHKMDLRSEKPESDLGNDGYERLNNLRLLLLLLLAFFGVEEMLQWSFGLLSTEKLGGGGGGDGGPTPETGARHWLRL
ncbi:hypothetical protein TorRG33x02_017880 [Trema orientale]|uniref:Uncharacterized protein n=1 Tax=Trema orientale TaxID=63057 RepID=A0A2P5FYC5_TREOI|nr:hypothetical protein TorRG33x02_017880 [Trema orientale]